MQTKKSDTPQFGDIRKELQQIKDRINLLEATLDIQTWKENLATEENHKQTEDDPNLKFTSKSDDSIES